LRRDYLIKIPSITIWLTHCIRPAKVLPTRSVTLKSRKHVTGMKYFDAHAEGLSLSRSVEKIREVIAGKHDSVTRNTRNTHEA